MLPKTMLSNATFSASLSRRYSRPLLDICLESSKLITRQRIKKISIIEWQRPYTMQVIGQDHPVINAKDI